MPSYHKTDIVTVRISPSIGGLRLYDEDILVGKSTITFFLDCVRHLLIVSGTVAVLYLAWILEHRVLGVVSAIPVYVMFLRLFDFLMLPLYMLTPEHRVDSVVLKAIQKGDLDRASRILEAHEKPYLAKLWTGSSGLETIRRISGTDLLFSSLIVLLLLLSGHETVLDRLSFFDEHRVWKAMFPCLVFGLCFVIVTRKIRAEWHEVQLERARDEIENILRKRGRASFERLGRMKPEYAPKLLDELIRTYPNVFRRMTIKKKKKPGITLTKE